MNTIHFNRISEAKNILKSGISATGAYAKSEMQLAAWYLTHKTTYTQSQAEERLRRATTDYFKGLPNEYIDSVIKGIIADTKAMADSVDEVPAPIVIYKEELNEIAKLHHADTERLAFAFLCVAKMNPQFERLFSCNSEIFRIAWGYLYDEKCQTVLSKQETRRVGGREPSKRVRRLCDAGLLKFYVSTVSPYKRGGGKPSASSQFSVPFVRTDGEVAFVIDKPERDSLVLYLDRYLGYKGIISCEKCGRPVLKTGRRQKYCSECADIINHHPEKRDS